MRSIILSFSLVLLCSSVAMAADAAKGQQLFAQRCATCHGPQGAGDGPVAASLPPDMKPRNLKEGAMKYATDDAKFKELLKKGGGGVGLNALMPAQSDLADADLDNVIAFVHSLKK